MVLQSLVLEQKNQKLFRIDFAQKFFVDRIYKTSLIRIFGDFDKDFEKSQSKGLDIVLSIKSIVIRT